MSAKLKKYYANGITAHGFYSLFSSLRKELEHLFIIQGALGTGKSALVKEVAEELLGHGLDLEIIHSPRDNNALDGFLVPKLKTGLMISSFPFYVEPRYCAVVDRVINLDIGLDLGTLQGYKQKIINLTDRMYRRFDRAIQYLANAKEIHLEREALYLQYMDFKQADGITERLLSKIFSNKKEDRGAEERRFFLGATTSQGVLNFIDDLTQDIERRIIIKGRAGTGKSTMLNKIVQEAKQRGFDSEIFLCGFDPASLDMVILPQLGFAIVDGTDPHPIEATRMGDELLDMYALCFTKDVDAEEAVQLQNIVARYKQATSSAIGMLGEAREVQEQLEQIYSANMDFELVHIKKKYILDTLLAFDL